MKRLCVVAAFATLFLAISPPATAASPHFMKTAPQCHVSGYTVTCDSSVIAGVGNFNARADLIVNISAHVDCYNPGNNPNNPIESHEATTSGSDTSGQLEPKNGKLTIPELTASVSPDPANFPCPNPNWSAVVSNVSFSYTYTITFLTDPPTVFYSLP